MTIDNAADGKGKTNGLAAQLNAQRKLSHEFIAAQVDIPEYTELFVHGCQDHIACLVDAEKQRLFLKQAKVWGLNSLVGRDYWGKDRWEIFSLLKRLSKRYRTQPMVSRWRAFARQHQKTAARNGRKYGVCYTNLNVHTLFPYRWYQSRFQQIDTLQD